MAAVIMLAAPSMSLPTVLAGVVHRGGHLSPAEVGQVGGKVLGLDRLPLDRLRLDHGDRPPSRSPVRLT